MHINSILLISALVVALLLLSVLVKMLRKMVRAQIDNQMESMVPVKAIRDRIAIKIKWSKYS